MSKCGFQELLVWQKAKRLAVDVYQRTGQGKLARDWGLVDQMRRSAVSVPSNIAEGDERNTDKDSVRCLYIAKGSLVELYTQVIIAQEVGYLSMTEADPLTQQCSEVGKMLGGLIKARSRTSVFKVFFLGIALGLLMAYVLPIASRLNGL
jgi:four helix bundle protein